MSDRLVRTSLGYFGDNLLLLDELRVELGQRALREPLLLRASEFEKLDRVLEHGTDRAGYPGDRRWRHDPSLAHVDVILATTPEQNRRAEVQNQPGTSTSLRKLPLIDAPMILVYAAGDFMPLPSPHEYRFRDPDHKSAALRAIFPITKHPLPDGWFRADEGMAYRALVELALVDRALGLGGPGTIVEVGCWLGRSTSYIGRLCRSRGAKLICIDTWAGSSDRFDAAYRELLATRDIAAEFHAHLTTLNPGATCCRKSSIEAAAEFETGTIDLVFLDASHDHAAITADLAAWWPRLRAGGILAGHDFVADRHPEVVAAVTQFAREHDRQVEREAGSVWWLVS